MTIYRTDRHETFANGQLVSFVEEQVDVTTEVVTYDLHAKARKALTANAAYLALATPTNAQVAAQVKALTRQTNALIRLLVAADLLTDNTGT